LSETVTLQECPERAEEKSCFSNTSWVGGLQKTVDGQLFLQCCEYPLMEKYGQLMFTNVSEASMILRDASIVLIVVVSNLHAEFCGNNRIPFGIEVIV
ncbi:hypothetical protein ANCDUO_18641, partial [Ancylostoma duodenale]